jgi:hypothetical protein
VPVPACICASCFKLHVLRRRCYRRWNTASGWRRLGQWRIMNSHASIPGRLLQAPGVYSMIVWLQLSPAVCCVSCVQLTTRFVVVATNTAEKCVALFDGDMSQKVNVLGHVGWHRNLFQQAMEILCTNLISPYTDSVVKRIMESTTSAIIFGLRAKI